MSTNSSTPVTSAAKVQTPTPLSRAQSSPVLSGADSTHNNNDNNSNSPGGSSNHSSFNGTQPLTLPVISHLTDPLTKAVHEGVASKVRTLLATHKGTSSHLIVSSFMGCDDVVSLLLKQSQKGQNDIDINAKNEDGHTALHVAVFAGSQKCVEKLLAATADPKIRSPDDSSSLHTAAAMGHVQILKLLIRHGAQINDKDHNGETPLIIAATKGRTEVAMLLLQANADANIKDNAGFTALHRVVRSGHLETLDRILECLLTDVDAQQEQQDDLTALHMAVIDGKTRFASVLLRGGASLMVRTKATKMTPLHLACLHGRQHIVELILQAISLAVKKRQAYSPGTGGGTGLSEEEKKPILDALDSKGRTPIIIAAHLGFTSIVDLLIRAGADFNRCDNEGNTPVHTAAREGHLTTLNCILVADGLIVDAKNKAGDSALHIAARTTRAEIVKNLLIVGCSPSAANNEARTPLQVATDPHVITTIKQHIQQQNQQQQKA